jgi:intraflagellar transport protein 56
MFRLYNGKAALDVLDASHDGKANDENDLIRHNTIVFNDGEKALQVLPGLEDYSPEARLNLAIFYIKQGEFDAATELIGDMDADSPQSHFAMGILNAKRAQAREDAKAFATACQASTGCVTVAGRQCKAVSAILSNEAI